VASVLLRKRLSGKCVRKVVQVTDVASMQMACFYAKCLGTLNPQEYYSICLLNITDLLTD
jgi:hypothetical protein